jgi:hypothetical protein
MGRPIHNIVEGQPFNFLVAAAQAHCCTMPQVACQQQIPSDSATSQHCSVLSITGVRKSNAQQMSKSAETEAVTSGCNDKLTSRMCSARVHDCST